MRTTTDTISRLRNDINALRPGPPRLSFRRHAGRVYRINDGPARDTSFDQASCLRDILTSLRAVTRLHRVEHGTRIRLDRGAPMVGMGDDPLACMLHGYADAHVLTYVREHVCPECSVVAPALGGTCGACAPCGTCAGAESAEHRGGGKGPTGGKGDTATTPGGSTGGLGVGGARGWQKRFGTGHRETSN